MKHQIPREVDFTDDEIRQIENWNKKHDRACPLLVKKLDKYTSEFYGRTFSFTPTSIGTIITIRCVCGEEFIVDNNL